MSNHREKGNEAFKKGDFVSSWTLYTQGLSEDPTDPFLWCNRSLVNIKLETFELGYMDAQKARDLLTSSSIPNPNSPYSTRLLEDINLQSLLIKAYRRMAESMSLFGVSQRAVVILENLINHPTYSKYITNNKDKEDFNAMLEKCRNKSKSTRETLTRSIPDTNASKQEYIEKCLDMGSSDFDYPWDRKRQENRCSDANIQLLQKELTPYLQCNVSVGRVTFANSNSSNSSSSGFSSFQIGVFTEDDIPEGMVIWKEEPFLVVHPYTIPRCHHCARRIRGVNNEHPEAPPNFKCEKSNCDEVFCSKQCYEMAESRYHTLLCGKDLQPLLSLVRQGKSGNNDKNPMMLLKLFAIAKIKKISPLDVSNIRYLSQFHPSKPSSPSIHNTSTTLPAILIEYYLETLSILGISPYDAKYDFWIYITLFNILRVNVFGSPGYLCLYRFISLINHSCQFNITTLHLISNDEDRTPKYEFEENDMAVISSREIERGEQILASYCDPNISKMRRGMVLVPTYGFECDCEKCKNEDPKDLSSLYSIPLWLIKTPEE
ncbi:1214_t:CDS:1 [Acaulospora morrowiae]|uniref:Histone-lysine N-methyltransferase SET5 n=1 Tax=Acaulospora morrowiae TaxID=94023 RepID=A0A9N9BQR7_9GLOM|nr:1214_t:CDS:1 [Acaulospora morrowiae]